MMYKKILLPLDGSELAEQALDHAGELAEKFQAELILIRIIEPLKGLPGVSISAIEESEALACQLAREYLEKVASGIADKNFQVQRITLVGLPHEKIIEYAEKNSVELIVLCTRGHSGFSRWLMGTVADRVTRGGKTPVLLIRAR